MGQRVKGRTLSVFDKDRRPQVLKFEQDAASISLAHRALYPAHGHITPPSSDLRDAMQRIAGIKDDGTSRQLERSYSRRLLYLQLSALTTAGARRNKVKARSIRVYGASPIRALPTCQP